MLSSIERAPREYQDNGNEAAHRPKHDVPKGEETKQHQQGGAKAWAKDKKQDRQQTEYAKPNENTLHHRAHRVNACHGGKHGPGAKLACVVSLSRPYVVSKCKRMVSIVGHVARVGCDKKYDDDFQDGLSHGSIV